MRESDKVLVDLLRKHIGNNDIEGTPELLDIGCSTGNLLLHLKRLAPSVNMTGGDLALSSIEEAFRIEIQFEDAIEMITGKSILTKVKKYITGV